MQMNKTVLLISTATFGIAIAAGILIVMIMAWGRPGQLLLDSSTITQPAATSTDTELASAPVPQARPSTSTNNATATRSEQQKVDEVQYAIGILQSEGVPESIKQTALLIDKEGDKARIISSMNLDDPRFANVPQWRCTFWSKLPKEISVNVTVKEYYRIQRLVVFEVEHKDLPTAVDWRKRVDIKEKDKVLAFGCRSQMKAAITQNEYPTIAESAAIGTVPFDALDYGYLIYLNELYDPEMSGGPVINSDSDLVGIVAQADHNGKSSKLIPVHALQSIFKARARDISCRMDWYSSVEQGYTLSFFANNGDGAIKEAHWIGFRGLRNHYPNPDGTWSLINAPTEYSHSFPITQTECRFSFTIPNFDDVHQAQLLVKLRDGKEWCSSVVLLQKGKFGDHNSNVPAALDKENKIVEAYLPGLFSKFCINPETRDLVALSPNQKAIALFSSSQLEARSLGKPLMVRVDQIPLAILYKRWNQRSYYLVSYRDSNRIDLFAAEDLKFVKNFEVEMTGPQWMASSESDLDPLIFFVSPNGASRESTFGYDMAADRSLGEINNTLTEFAMYCDKHSALYISGHANQIGFITMKKNPESGRISFGGLQNTEIYGKKFHFNYNRNFLVADRAIYDASSQKRLGVVDGNIDCILDSQPLLLAHQYAKFQLYSTNTFEPVGKQLELYDFDEQKMLPNANGNSNFPFNNSLVEPIVVADEKNQQFMLVSMSRILFVPFQAFGSKDSSAPAAPDQ